MSTTTNIFTEKWEKYELFCTKKTSYSVSLSTIEMNINGVLPADYGWKPWVLITKYFKLWQYNVGENTWNDKIF